MVGGVILRRRSQTSVVQDLGEYRSPRYCLSASRLSLGRIVEEDTTIGEDGFPPGRDCPVCGRPLEPGHIDASLELVWLCPDHGMIDTTPDPLTEE